jgi:subtilisin family serine protease
LSQEKAASGPAAAQWRRVFPLSGDLRVLPAHDKVGPGIMDAVTALRARGITRANARALDAASASSPLVHVDNDGAVQVYLHVSSVGLIEKNALESLEAKLEVVLRRERLIQAWIPFDHIEAVADLDFVERITRPSYAHRWQGSVTSAGDGILRARQLRNKRGLTGKGVKVGVLSAGAWNIAASQATGDLPGSITTFGTCNFSVWQSTAACDEGTAMMEIVHDLAPKAKLGFAAVSTSAQFIKRARKLVNEFGADILVDDLGFLTEPYFEDGRVAKRANRLGKDVVFISAAGNSARGHYEKGFKETSFNGSAPILGSRVHDFGKAAGKSKDVSMNVAVPAGATLTVFLQWTNRFGKAEDDYDLYILNDNDSSILSASVTAQSQTGTPIEAAAVQNLGSSTGTVHIVINKFSGKGQLLEMYINGGTVRQYNRKKGSVFGHPAAKNVLAVGAISASDPNNDKLESFSSRGPVKIFFPNKQSRKKPDITGIDQVETTGPGDFPTIFPGTSAAAPHLAGIAALLLDFKPRKSPAEIRRALVRGADDLGKSGPDNKFGAGRADAVRAANRL